MYAGICINLFMTRHTGEPTSSSAVYDWQLFYFFSSASFIPKNIKTIPVNLSSQPLIL